MMLIGKIQTAYRYLAFYRHHIIRQIIKPIIYKVEGVSFLAHLIFVMRVTEKCYK